MQYFLLPITIMFSKSGLKRDEEVIGDFVLISRLRFDNKIFYFRKSYDVANTFVYFNFGLDL